MKKMKTLRRRKSGLQKEERDQNHDNTGPTGGTVCSMVGRVQRLVKVMSEEQTKHISHMGQ